MAEAFAKLHGRDLLEPYSAGIKPAGFIHPKVLTVMEEAGIDLSQHISKPIEKDLLAQMDWIVLMTEDVKSALTSAPPSAQVIQWQIIDPVSVFGKGERVLQAFRMTRDKIEMKVKELVALVKPL